MIENQTIVKEQAPKVVGSFVKVSFPEFAFGSMTAKVDTGAYTGAMHCTNIHEKIVKKVSTIYFSPFGHPEIVKSADNYIIKLVKSSNGVQEKRFMIDTVIKLNGVVYPIRLTLADRSDMEFPVLIGRRFLHTYNFLVDVKIGAQHRLMKGKNT